MTSSMIITYRKFEKCPLSSQTREIVGHVSAFSSTYTGMHHFAHHCIGIISDLVLRRMDNGEMLGGYSQDGATVVWRVEK